MSKIEWTEATWNPIAGCSKVSPGCTHCYAETMAGRLDLMGSPKYAGLTVLQGSHRVWTGKIAFDEQALLAPLRRKKPTRYFVNSMSDLFHPNVTDRMRDRVVAAAALCPQHTLQCLTKRPDTAREYFAKLYTRAEIGRIAEAAERIQHGGVHTPEWLRNYAYQPAVDVIPPLMNWWQGTSVESQKYADERIPLLLQTPAALRFISAEPLLGPVDIKPFTGDLIPLFEPGRSPLEGCGLPTLVGYARGLDWVIVGGESGPGARPFNIEWARSIVRQCAAAGVPVFCKQLGAKPEGNPLADGINLKYIFKHRKGGDPSEWPEDLRVRQMPEVRA